MLVQSVAREVYTAGLPINKLLTNDSKQICFRNKQTVKGMTTQRRADLYDLSPFQPSSKWPTQTMGSGIGRTRRQEE